jgi:chlorite dismutase
VLGADVLTPTFSYLSMTERSEYTTSEAEYAAQLTEEENLQPGSPEHEVKMFAFRQRMEKYLKDRLYPVLPPWPVVCFYPMSKRRGDAHNWYALPFEERKKLMLGHARIGRQWHGKILQLITGSTGLDDWEWGCDAARARSVEHQRHRL